MVMDLPFFLDSVLNDGVIVATSSTSSSLSLGPVPAGSTSAEQRAICRIQSQLMRETANIAPPPQPSKLLGQLLSQNTDSGTSSGGLARGQPSIVPHRVPQSTQGSLSSALGFRPPYIAGISKGLLLELVFYFHPPSPLLHPGL